MSKLSVSPLRYPGGKSSLLDMLGSIIHNNEFRYFQYAEPYAGGSGLALALMYGGYVSHIHLNDIDPAIWSFWHSVLNHSNDLVKMIEVTPITLKEREKQREIYLESDRSDPLLLGFAAFFLNRTNRSGIIKGAGVIGGKLQNGNYKIDCRFNRENLSDRIRRIYKYKDRITLYNQDAVHFMKNSGGLSKNTLFFIDPPYYNKGAALYTSFYKPEDHETVAQTVGALDHPWLVTYDNTQSISRLYDNFRQYSFNINYSLRTKRKGDELLITSDDVYIGSELNQYRKVG